jgi:Asp/Glu/hydantoin racemase
MKIACLTSKHIPLAAVAPPGCEVVEYTYQNPFAGSEPLTWRVADLIVAATGIRAVQDGCDAIIVNALSDFGVSIMRDVMKGPIVGAAYAVSCAAGAFGDRYSLVDIWPEASCGVVNQRFKDYGIFDKFASLRFLHDDEFMGDAQAVATNFTEVTTCDVRYVNRVAAEIDKAIEEDSPDAILLGCTCMSAAAPKLNERVSVPVLNASQVAVDMAASLAAQHGPVTLNDADAGRFWISSITNFIQQLGNKALELHEADIAAFVGAQA